MPVVLWVNERSIGMENKMNPVKKEVDALLGDAVKQKTFREEQTFANDFQAKLAFQAAAGRLFDVNSWSTISVLTADFVLYSSNGKPKPVMLPQSGDYIRIQLPGPVPENWVRIFDVNQSGDHAEFSAHPCQHPLSDTKAQTDHFFKHSTISTFRIERLGNTLIGSQIGKDEQINNQQPEAGDRQVINTVIAEAGWLFYQSVQWNALCRYWVNG
nr:hypothetical protein [uncultured Arsenicibacter sp.]